MPIFNLGKELLFPPPDFAEENGLLAIGGDIRPERIVYAYERGIFPWYDAEEGPIFWWSPDPRTLIDLGSLKISNSLLRTLKKEFYEIRIDTVFESVLNHCSKIKRKDGDGTWIHAEMRKSYLKLHELGVTHSIETYYEGRLVGGLFGLSLGCCFFGESMFHLQTDASKIALVFLNALAKNEGLELIDCQLQNSFLKQMGAYQIPRKKYLERLKKSVFLPSPFSDWKNCLSESPFSYIRRAL